jgi:hypothetical protein
MFFVDGNFLLNHKSGKRFYEEIGYSKASKTNYQMKIYILETFEFLFFNHFF